MFIRSSRLFQAALGCAAIAAMGCSTDDAAQSAPQQLSTAQCQAFDVNGDLRKGNIQRGNQAVAGAHFTAPERTSTG